MTDDWYDLTEEMHQRTYDHGCRLDSLPLEWQRELAALWRVEADVNNGGYLQFLSNWGRESSQYASAGLHKIGATRMAEIVDTCLSLVDEQFSSDSAVEKQRGFLMWNRVIDVFGKVVKREGSRLPSSVVDRIDALSVEFITYPDTGELEDLSNLGMAYYSRFIDVETLERE